MERDALHYYPCQGLLMYRLRPQFPTFQLGKVTFYLQKEYINGKNASIN